MSIAIVIVGLAIFIIGLAIYNMILYKKLRTLSNTREMVSNLNVLQQFMDIIGKDVTTDKKIKEINNIIIQQYSIKYSTIVMFDGTEYLIKATNVSKENWEKLKKLHENDVFKESILTATPKHIKTGKDNQKLAYQNSKLGIAKSAIFFPLYIGNVYVGYWFIESAIEDAFEKMDTSLLSIIKDNIISVLKTISYQNSIENLARVDKGTGLNTVEYLYGEGRNVIDQYDVSTISMFEISNIMEINEEFSRDIGTKIIQEIANAAKNGISANHCVVRFQGPKFAVSFAGEDIERAKILTTTLKEQLTEVKVITDDDKVVKAKINFVLATYYKGTGLEEIIRKLEEYLDMTEDNDSIVCI